MSLKSILVFIVTLPLLGTSGKSQPNKTDSNILLGKWVTLESYPSDVIDAPTNSNYLKYEFLTDNLFYYSSNEIERGLMYVYHKSDNIIELFGVRYTIRVLDENVVELTGGQLRSIPQTKVMKLVRKEKYDSIWGIRLKNKINAQAQFVGNFQLHDYIFSPYKRPKKYINSVFNGYYNPRTPKSSRYFSISFIVESTGVIRFLNATSTPELKPRKIKKLKEKLEATTGLWEPQKNNGKSIADTLTLNFLNQSVSILQIKSLGLTNFKKGYYAYLDDDFKAAVYYSNQAVMLDSKKFQYYLLRAAAYIKLGEVEKYCQDLQAASSLNPFVSLTNTEIIENEVLEINCGGQ